MPTNRNAACLKWLEWIAARERPRPKPRHPRFQPRVYVVRSIVRRTEPPARPSRDFRDHQRAKPYRFIQHLYNLLNHRTYFFVQVGPIVLLRIPIPLTFDTSLF